jgi:hypothetical protein
MIKGLTMKTVFVMMIGIAFAATLSNAQFKSQVENQPSVSQSLVHPMTSINSFLGILNPDNFSMQHSLSMSYMSFGGTGISLASYTNSMFYKIADPLNIRFDLTLQGSPFGNYGSLQQSDLSKLFVSRAQLNYRPLENMFIRLEYNQLPAGRYYYDAYSPYRSSLMYGDE